METAGILTLVARTGSTGYIGGDVLASIASQFPAASITALVRDTAKAKPITDKYPGLQLQQGDLDSADVIEAAVKEADVIISMCLPPGTLNLRNANEFQTLPTANTLASSTVLPVAFARPAERVLVGFEYRVKLCTFKH